MTKLGEENDQTGGGRSFDDCDNICEWNLLFDVIFRKFMCWRVRICAQLTSGNVYFFHYRRSKWKPHFFRGSFTRLTSQVRRGTCLGLHMLSRHVGLLGLLNAKGFQEGLQHWGGLGDACVPLPATRPGFSFPTRTGSGFFLSQNFRVQGSSYIYYY